MTRVIVIGAGIVGLSIAHNLVKEGDEVVLVDRDPAGDKTSFGNAGGVAVTEVMPASAPGLIWRVPRWLVDPLGPLAIRPGHLLSLSPWLLRFWRACSPAEVARLASALAALNGRVYTDLLPMLAETGLRDELKMCGALTVYETDAGFARDAQEWRHKQHLGVQAQTMSGDEARAMEPALGPIVKHAVLTPDWSIVTDPKRIVEGLSASLAARGIETARGIASRVEPISADSVAVALQDGRRLVGDTVVVAAGAWSGSLARQVGDPVSLESERGYNLTITDPKVTLSRQIIFGERKFVATPLSCGLRIGGAVEFGGLNAAADYRRSWRLSRLAAPYLPGLDPSGGRPWAGHRPSTPDSLPVIGPSPRHPRIVYAFGHGHLGLTQAATTGRMVADIIHHQPAVIDLKPFAIERFRQP